MDKKKTIREEFLQFIWRTKNFQHKDLLTTDGREVSILNFGQWNQSDGPDFLNGKIRIDNIVWNGDIEIHVNSSDWQKHKHSENDRYTKIILHVVYNNDVDITLNDKQVLPCLELKQKIYPRTLQNYAKLDKLSFIPCEKFISSVPKIVVENAKQTALHHKITRKIYSVENIGNETINDWQETLYRLLLRSFGLHKNAGSFFTLSQRIPYQKIIKKNTDKPIAIEAMLLGAAGLLNYEFNDEYPQKLKEEYNFYKKKYLLEFNYSISLNLKSVRPSNFPWIRISQFSQLITKKNILSNLLEYKELTQIRKLLSVKASQYWDTHYNFDKKSIKRSKALGDSFKDIIIINAIIPSMIHYGEKYDNEKVKQGAYHLLNTLKAEKNSIIAKWRQRDIHVKNAYDSQSLLELKRSFCDQKRCLSCTIGYYIINKA